MASLHFCVPKVKVQKTTYELQRMTTSAPYIANITNLSKLKSTRVCSLGLKSLHQTTSQSHESTEQLINSAVEKSLKIGIIGFGAFGQFLAMAFQRKGHSVLATSRSDYSEYCQQRGIEYFGHLNDLCEAQPDVLLVCSSIMSTENIVRGIPFHKLKPNTILADVLSVKQFPKNLFLEVVPANIGVLCTHPMFGKFSGKNSWDGLRFVYEKVRVEPHTIQEQKCHQFLSIFQDEGCQMVEMSCEEHDQFAAKSQFLTHTIARILSNMNLESTPIDTKGYETLMELTRNAVSHGSDLYDGLFLYNNNAATQIEKLEEAFDKVKKVLFSKLRDTVRVQIEETASGEATRKAVCSSQFLAITEKELQNLSSFSMVAEKRSVDAEQKQ